MKRQFHKSLVFAAPPPPASENAVQQAWQKQAPIVAMALGLFYFYYDNRRLKKSAALESQLEPAAALQELQLQQQQLAAPALVVSEQQPDLEFTHQNECLQEAEETVVVDSVEPLVDHVEEVLDHTSGEPEAQDMQQDSGKSEVDPSTASEVVPPLNPDGESPPGETPAPADEDKLAVPPAVVLEEEETKEQHQIHQKQQEPTAPGEIGAEEETTMTPATGSGAVPVKHDNNVVRFKDIQGYGKAKRDLAGVVELLKDPKSTDANAKKLGGKTPKGVVIFGPRCCGKKTIARAVAGEAEVPFVKVEGGDAETLKRAFIVAKGRAPCVLFVDGDPLIDNVGIRMQLKQEMANIPSDSGIIVMTSARKRDQLDKSLLNTGFMELEIKLYPPNQAERRSILARYLNEIKMDGSTSVGTGHLPTPEGTSTKEGVVDSRLLTFLARGTSGFTAGTLERLVNMAVSKALLDKKDGVTLEHLEWAKDQILGHMHKERLPDAFTNEVTAWHEAGHAVVSLFSPHSHPIHRLTIIPRESDLGYTSYIPEAELYSDTKGQLMTAMDRLLAGRIAEELIYGDALVSTRSKGDLKQATNIAAGMVKTWGMTSRFKCRSFDTDAVTLDASFARLINVEVQRLLEASYERSRSLLLKYHREHKALAEALLKDETLDGEEIDKVVQSVQKLYLDTENVSLLSEAHSQKVSITRSTSSVAPAGAASGVVDVAPVKDETPQPSQTSTKTGVIQTPKDAANTGGDAKKGSSKTPASTKSSAPTKDPDSSVVAADRKEDGVNDILEWIEDSQPKEGIDDDSMKDSLAAEFDFQRIKVESKALISENEDFKTLIAVVVKGRNDDACPPQSSVHEHDGEESDVKSAEGRESFITISNFCEGES